VVTTPETPLQSVAKLAQQIGPRAWYRRTVSEGTKGPIVDEFARKRVTLCKDEQPAQTVWLVLKRTLEAEPRYWYYISNAPECAGEYASARVCLVEWGTVGHRTGF